ncbi:MAG: leucine-rich repeat domain-containing protein [Candidatus Thorarchaeota archaeon]
MAFNPKKIYEDLEKGEIDKLTAVDLLIYLIGNNDLIETREECIENLLRIGVKNDKVFSVLEDLLVSDPNPEIRELSARGLKILFKEDALPPLKWALDHEKSWQLLVIIVSIIQESDNLKAIRVLFNKIKKIDDYKFIKNLKSLLKTGKIQNLKSKNLAEILNNYIVINHLKDTLKEFNYQIENGLVEELDLSFVSNKTFGWKILKHLSELIEVINNLKRLKLKSNKIGKFPESIFSLNSIAYLDLSHNNISILPDQFEGMQSLEYLNLRYNQLTLIPHSIGALKNLKTLDLKHNKLSNLPPSISNLSSLEVLNLHGNQLNTLPSSLKELYSLEKLKLGLNNLKSVPKWVRNLRSLKKLSLGGNKSLSNIEEWIVYLPPISELNLYDSDIKSIPESIGSFDSLEALILPNNHISTLPEPFKNLTSLKILDLSWNDITYLPEWIDSLISLEELNLRGNKLSSLPESISSLQSLKTLDITLNKNIIQLPKDFDKGVQIVR